MDAVLGRRNHHAGHEEREEERDDRDDDPAGALFHRKPGGECPCLGGLVRTRRGCRIRHAASAFRPPSISSPICSSDTSPVCSATICPS